MSHPPTHKENKILEKTMGLQFINDLLQMGIDYKISKSPLNL